MTDFRNGPGVLYDRDRCIALLVEKGDMDYYEAVDFFDNKVARSESEPGTENFMRPIVGPDSFR
jgi:hypothetical protein